MEGTLNIALMAKCDSIYCVTVLPSLPPNLTIVNISRFAAYASAFVAVTYKEDKP
jgi:hypothetical protein